MSGPLICPSIAPWVVGGEAVYVLGMKGVIEAKTEDTLTIGGLTLPTRLNSERGIRYLSMTWPEGDETVCDREHCAGGCGEDSDDETDADHVAALQAAISDEHDAEHGGPFRFCSASICRAVWA